MASPAAKVTRLRELLQSELQDKDVQRFEESDLQLLVSKGFATQSDLEEATREHLQGPPGEAVKPLLINALLQTFHPAALQQGMVWPLRARA